MFFQYISDALINGQQVKISGFGNFTLHDKRERPGRNPRTGEEVPVTARRVVTFHCGQKLKARVEKFIGKETKDTSGGEEVKRKQRMEKDLPAIPDKLYFTISEVSDLCAVKAYVLRYWEQEFPQLKPVKRRGNRRYYQHQDIILIRQIRKLLYEEGFTIEGARTQLSNMPEAVSQSVKMDVVVKKVIADLESVLQNLQSEMKASH